MKTEHILIIRFSAMGDVAMLVPVVSSLAEQYPHVRITVLSQPFAASFFENIAPNVHFMAADIKKEYKGVKGLNALYRRLIAKKFTAIADCHDVLRTKYLRMRYKMSCYNVAHINKHRADKHRLTRRDNKHLEPVQSAFLNYADVFAKLGYPVNLHFDTLIRPQQDDIDSLLAKLHIGAKAEPWIGIAPFAAHNGKIYPIEKTRQVISTLTERHPDARIFLFGGGAKEMDTFAQWEQQLPQCITAARHLRGLHEELLLMSQLDVMLSMDSANMHLASLVATPVVSIWGATHPYAGFMGWNQKAEDAIQADLPCRPCSIYGSRKCHRGDYACLNTILPETIVSQIESHLD